MPVPLHPLPICTATWGTQQYPRYLMTGQDRICRLLGQSFHDHDLYARPFEDNSGKWTDAAHENGAAVLQHIRHFFPSFCATARLGRRAAIDQVRLSIAQSEYPERGRLAEMLVHKKSLHARHGHIRSVPRLRAAELPSSEAP